MLKNQKHFSASECEICKERDGCTYGRNSDEFYRQGYKIPVRLCKRLNRSKTVSK